MKQTLKQANYTYLHAIKFADGGKCEHVLLNNETGEKEVFFANKYHGSWGLIYKNTHLEFARTIHE